MSSNLGLNYLVEESAKRNKFVQKMGEKAASLGLNLVGWSVQDGGVFEVIGCCSGRRTYMQPDNKVLRLTFGGTGLDSPSCDIEIGIGRDFKTRTSDPVDCIVIQVVPGVKDGAERDAGLVRLYATAPGAHLIIDPRQFARIAAVLKERVVPIVLGEPEPKPNSDAARRRSARRASKTRPPNPNGAGA